MSAWCTVALSAVPIGAAVLVEEHDQLARRRGRSCRACAQLVDGGRAKTRGSRGGGGHDPAAQRPAPGRDQQGVGEQRRGAGRAGARPARSGSGRRRRSPRPRPRGLGQAERDALAGQRVDVARGVADQQHPARARVRSTAGAAVRRRAPGSAADAVEPLAQRGNSPSSSSKDAAPLGQHRDADQVVGDRRHVGLARSRPSAPRRTASTAPIGDVRAQPVAARGPRGRPSSPSIRRTGECSPSAATR